MLELGLKVLISYLLGSLNGSLIIGRLRGVDIRTMGSGNPGGTNALRTQGKWFAFWVMVIDVGKGWLPAWLLPALAIPAVGLDAEISRTWLALACAAGAVVGHCYPVWFGFAGGKGAATAIGALLLIAPAVLIPALAVWVAVLIGTGFVGLATISAAWSMPAYLVLTNPSGNADALVFLLLLASFILFTHRDNIQRMRDGEENRLERVMLLRRTH
jgi:glycerol-3-phosphate acyltransferase PlsY